MLSETSSRESFFARISSERTQREVESWQSRYVSSIYHQYNVLYYNYMQVPTCLFRVVMQNIRQAVCIRQTNFDLCKLSCSKNRYIPITQYQNSRYRYYVVHILLQVSMLILSNNRPSKYYIAAFADTTYTMYSFYVARLK